MSDKVDFQKHPAFAHLGSGNNAHLGFLAQFLFIQLKEVRGLGQVKRFHGNRTRRTNPASTSAGMLRHGLKTLGSTDTCPIPLPCSRNA